MNANNQSHQLHISQHVNYQTPDSNCNTKPHRYYIMHTSVVLSRHSQFVLLLRWNWCCTLHWLFQCRTTKSAIRTRMWRSLIIHGNLNDGQTWAAVYYYTHMTHAARRCASDHMWASVPCREAVLFKAEATLWTEML